MLRHGICILHSLISLTLLQGFFCTVSLTSLLTFFYLLTSFLPNLFRPSLCAVRCNTTCVATSISGAVLPPHYQLGRTDFYFKGRVDVGGNRAAIVLGMPRFAVKQQKCGLFPQIHFPGIRCRNVYVEKTSGQSEIHS